MPLVDDACPCGAPFLPDAGIGLRPLPGIGDITALGRGQRVALGAAAALLGTVLLVGLLSLLGAAGGMLLP